MINYLNALPFYLHQSYPFTFDVPAKLNAALKEGTLDGSFVSVTCALDNKLPFLPYCIAADGEILSVNLYIREDIKDLSETTIALTTQSNASIALLKVLCHHFWKVEPSFTQLKSPLNNYKAFLLIGDDALRQMQIPGYCTIDLGLEWKKYTGLPFVFALFAYRNEGPFSSLFEKALSYSEKHSDQVVDEAHKRSGLDKQLLKRYYALCTYRFGEKEREGLKLFSTLRNTLCTEEKSLKV